MPVMTGLNEIPVGNFATRTPGQPWSLNDAAAFFGICRKSVERMIRDQKVKAIRFGTRVMLPDSEVKRVAEQGL